MRTDAWLITKDHIADKNEPTGTNLNAVGMFGPSNSEYWVGGHESTQDELRNMVKNDQDAIKFRLFDDDGELYYEGLMVMGDEDGFGPLDDFGGPNAGATRLDYYDSDLNKWVML